MQVGDVFETSKGFLIVVGEIPKTPYKHQRFILECSICSADPLLWPLGSITASKYDMEKYLPCGCSKNPRWKEFQQFERCRKAAFIKGLVFLGWAEEYRGQKTRCIIECEKHGVWDTTWANDLVNSVKSCPSCGIETRAKKKTKSEAERRSSLERICKEKGLAFVDFIERPIGWRSAIRVRCSKHGDFDTVMNCIESLGTGCPYCSRIGFQYGKAAFVYALLSNCGAYIKIGIANNLDTRINTLVKNTPFEFNLVNSIGTTGRTAKRIERAFHTRFNRAGFKGFDGATEWLLNPKDVIDSWNDVVHAQRY